MSQGVKPLPPAKPKSHNSSDQSASPNQKVDSQLVIINDTIFVEPPLSLINEKCEDQSNEFGSAIHEPSAQSMSSHQNLHLSAIIIEKKSPVPPPKPVKNSSSTLLAPSSSSSSFNDREVKEDEAGTAWGRSSEECTPTTPATPNVDIIKQPSEAIDPDATGEQQSHPRVAPRPKPRTNASTQSKDETTMQTISATNQFVNKVSVTKHSPSNSLSGDCSSDTNSAGSDTQPIKPKRRDKKLRSLKHVVVVTNGVTDRVVSKENNVDNGVSLTNEVFGEADVVTLRPNTLPLKINVCVKNNAESDAEVLSTKVMLTANTESNNGCRIPVLSVIDTHRSPVAKPQPKPRVSIKKADDSGRKTLTRSSSYGSALDAANIVGDPQKKASPDTLVNLDLSPSPQTRTASAKDTPPPPPPKNSRALVGSAHVERMYLVEQNGREQPHLSSIRGSGAWVERDYSDIVPDETLTLTRDIVSSTVEHVGDSKMICATPDAHKGSIITTPKGSGGARSGSFDASSPGKFQRGGSIASYLFGGGSGSKKRHSSTEREETPGGSSIFYLDVEEGNNNVDGATVPAEVPQHRRTSETSVVAQNSQSRPLIPVPRVRKPQPPTPNTVSRPISDGLDNVYAEIDELKESRLNGDAGSSSNGKKEVDCSRSNSDCSSASGGGSDTCGTVQYRRYANVSQSGSVRSNDSSWGYVAYSGGRDSDTLNGNDAYEMFNPVIDEEEEGEQVGEGLTPEDKEKQLIAKRKRKAFMIAQEIVSSEKTFVSVLKLLGQEFSTAVNEASKALGRPVITPTLLNQIIKYLPQLHNFNEDLLRDLTQRLRNWCNDARLADIFVKKGPFLKMYTDYIREFNAMVQLLDETRKKNSDFDKVVSDFESSSRCAKLALKHYMLKPIQRIPQYKMLLREYCDQLSEDSPDYKDANTAILIVQKVAEHANESIKYGDNLNKLLSIQNSLIGQFEVIIPGRALVKEGMLAKLSRKEMQQRMFYLFTDVLLYTTPVSSGFKLNNILPLANMKVCRPTKEDFQNEFSIITIQRSFTITAKSDEEREEWLKVLEETIKENMEKRFSYNKGKLTAPSIVNIEVNSNEFKIGTKAPVWIPDVRVSMCMICTAEFTVAFRRHHCRGCGKVICRQCSEYYPLRYLEGKVERVCQECFKTLNEDIDAMDPNSPTLAAEDGSSTITPGGNDSSTGGAEPRFDKQQIKAQFRGVSIHGLSAMRTKHKPAILQEVHANDENSDMSGYLKVLKSKRWKKLWFVLKDKVLYTFKASEDAAADESTVLLGFEVTPFNTVSYYSVLLTLRGYIIRILAGNLVRHSHLIRV